MISHALPQRHEGEWPRLRGAPDNALTRRAEERRIEVAAISPAAHATPQLPIKRRLLAFERRSSSVRRVLAEAPAPPDVTVGDRETVHRTPLDRALRLAHGLASKNARANPGGVTAR